MDSLIARLEAATEGNRELSDECLIAVGSRKEGSSAQFLTHRAIAPDGTEITWRSRPHVTGNVQDAIDHMVPEGWLWGLHLNDPRDIFGASLAQAFVRRAADDLDSYQHAEAATPALALSAASLKAIEARVAPSEGGGAA